MLIKLGKVNKFNVYEPNSEELESVKINIEVTPDEYIFYKPGLFSTKEIGKIQRKDVMEITNENLNDRFIKSMERTGASRSRIAEHKNAARRSGVGTECFYLTFLKGKNKSVEIYFDNTTSSDVDKIITKLK